MSLWDWLFAAWIVNGISNKNQSDTSYDPWHDDNSLEDPEGIWTEDDDNWGDEETEEDAW